MSGNRMFRTMWAGLVLFSLVAFLGACGGGGEGGSGPKVTGTITLSADVTSIPADGSSSANITATLKDSAGKPVANGTSVTFTTTLGHFRNGSTSYTVQTLPSDPFNIKSDPTGQVTVALIAGATAGSAKVTASGNGVSQSVYITLSGSAASITLAADPTTIPADGASSSTITATLIDSSGDPVSPGTEVTFTTTLGTFSTSAQAGEAVGTLESNRQTYTVYTADATGVVKVSLISATTAGSALVKATSNNVTQSIYVGFGGEPVSITLVADPVTIPADGASSSTITATLTDALGAAVTPGTSITFTTTLGSFLNGKTTYTTQTRDSSGTVSVSLISAATAGSALVKASANGVTQVVYVGFGGAPVSIALTANPTSIWADGKSSSAIQATLTDGAGNPVTPGTAVTFTTDLGTFRNGQQTYTVTTPDSTGIVTVSLIAGTTTGSALVSASSNGVAQSVYVTFIQKGGNPFAMVLTANPTSINADGTSSSKITATVTDSKGSPVNPGTSITFSTNLGSFSNGQKTYTVTTPDATGVVAVSLIAGTTAGSATVTATASGVTQSVTVTFIGAVVASISVTATPNSLTADGTSTSQIRAQVKDAQGNPIADGQNISFTITSGTGTLSATSATTVGGYATVTYIASNTPGQATIQAMASNNVYGTVSITLTSGGTASITLAAAPVSIPANGSSSSAITATLRDSAGKAVVKGTAVTFSTTLGTLSGTSVTTPDDTGVVTVSLIAGTTPGTATVTAQSGSVSQSVPVKFTGPPAAITVSATPQTLVADGKTTSSVKATVVDVNGNAVEDGEMLTASAQYGSISDINPTTTSGVAAITYTSPSSVPAGGTDAVSFRASNGVSGNAAITLTGPQVATVVLSADPAAIPANGTSTSTISATVTVQGGSPAPEGTSVTFTITSSAGGSFGGQKTTTKTTDANGVARATLTAGTNSGTETIKAEASGVSSNVISVTYQPGSITLTIVPNYLLATGADTAVVTAALKDVSGAPAPNGQTVNFSLSNQTLGTLSAASAITAGGKGEASVTFTSGTKGGTVTVTATWTPGGDAVTGTADITIQAPPAFIELTSGYPQPTAINIKGTGGQSTSELKFDVKDAKGSLVASGYRVDFSILTGPNGGEDLIPPSATTSDGQVTTFLHSGVRSGPVSIKATYHNDTTINATASQIVIVSGPPVGEAFGIAAQYLNISGFWVAGLADPVTANAADIYGNAIPDGTAVSFKTYNTGGYFATGSGTTTQGRATDNLMSGGTYLRPLNGFLSITAEAVGGKSTHVTALEWAPGTTTVYAGTNGGGVYKSVDNGATWTNVSRSSENPKQGQNWIDPYVKGHGAISVDPDNTDIVYVGTGYLGRGHVYRSKDGGANWNYNDAEEWHGVYSGNSAVLTVLCDGDDTAADRPYVWIGTEGEGVFYATDGETFTSATTGLTYGTTVREIVKVPNTHDNTAVLYAATHAGVYKSTNGGVNWAPTTGTFTQNNINTLALHPTNTNVLYAGTDSAWVWVSTDGGATWPSPPNPYSDGMGKGLSSSVPVADVNNTGNGTMSKVTVGPKTKSEFWSVTCTAAAPGSGTFEVVGSVSASQGFATVGTTYTSAASDISFLISDGAVDFNVGDFFTFTTIRDPGSTIKDLMVDAANNRLYAITYYMSPIEPYHAVGNVYVHQLNADGSMTDGTTWAEANTGLPQFEPPNDTTLFAQYVMATDDETSPTYFLIGGDGINLYRATPELSSAKPWGPSKTGLTNLLMARMPILFSGACTMTIWEYAGFVGTGGATALGANTFKSNTAVFDLSDSGKNLTILSGPDPGTYVITYVSATQVTLAGFSASATAADLKFNLPDRADHYGYFIYIQDTNGNPPISGSTFTAITYAADNQKISTLATIEYPDTYTYQGTFSDPADASTDHPYTFNVDFSDPVDHVTFTFTPTNKTTVPGSSGSKQEQTYYR